MADRDWDKELAKVDKQLASISDEQLMAGNAPAAPAGKGATPAARQSAAPREKASKSSLFGVYARLTLSVALGVGMTIWPYEMRCGAGLAAYLAAVVVVVTAGVWSSVWSWRHRAAKAHVLSLLLILWGLILGAQQVLPRVGYARADLLHPATWSCQ